MPRLKNVRVAGRPKPPPFGKSLTVPISTRGMASEGARIAEARRKVADLVEAVGGLGAAPGGVTTMIDSANLRRQADHLEKSDRVKSEAISAYAEYTGMLERALREVAEAQRQISSMARPEKAARAKPAGPKKARFKAGRAKPARTRKAVRAKPAGSKRPAGPKKARSGAGRARPARVRKAAPRRRR